MNAFLEIVRFELLYRLKRPASYIYFGLFFGIAILISAIPEVSYADGADQLYKNSPYLLTQIMLAILIFGSMVSAAIMGVPVYRDYEHEFYEILHSMPIRKTSLLWGRFIGSYLTTLLVFSSLGIGMALGFSMPWIQGETVAPFDPVAYTEAYVFFIAPNLFIIGSFFFIVGSFFRSQMAIYVQGLIFLVLYFSSNTLLENSLHSSNYALIDPFCLEAITQQTEYWTTFEKNNLYLGMDGIILKNRILWISLSLIFSILFNWKFSVSRRRKFSLFRRKEDTIHRTFDLPGIIPKIIPIRFSLKTRLIQLWYTSRFYFRDVVRSIPFLIILACSIGFMSISHFGEDNIYGTPTLPVSYMLVDNLSEGFIIFAIILLVIYSGELIWRDIGTRFSPILDSSPLSNQQIILSKFIAMIFAELLIMGVIILTGIGIQVINGFYDFQLSIYFKFLFLNFFPTLFLMTLLTFFIHTLAGNKFLGHSLIILFYIAQGFYQRLGVWDTMVQYARFPRISFSGMNGLQKFITPAISFQFYWLMLGIFFLLLSMLFIKRGAERSIRVRLQLFKINWKNMSLKMSMLVALLLFVLSGSWVYYNTHILNDFRSKKQEIAYRVNYEKTYERYRNAPQPRIVDVNLEVDIFPDDYGMKARGSYLLMNKNECELDSIHIRLLPEIDIYTLRFSEAAREIHSAPEYGYHIYQLDSALQPGDSLVFNFDISFFEEGFSNHGRRTEILPNGTFFTNSFLPYFGYDEKYILQDERERKRAGLPQKSFESAELTDSSSYHDTYISDNADRINYEAILSTSPDQYALTCGNLVDNWEQDGRAFFHYKMDVPIWNFIPFVSARYQRIKERHLGKDIEIYYHPGHEYNLERMKSAMKKTLSYCSSTFSPYQYKSLRIVEFPRYSSFAQSFPGIIPFSEGVGFIVDVDEKNDLDLPFYVTAHEVAHQWWGHQVSSADVKGKLLIVESLSNYTALMVMEKTFGKEKVGEFLEREQSSYLKRRSFQEKEEVPLKEVDQELYLAYQKGSIIFYALRHYLGEENLNKQLASFMNYYSGCEGSYPTSEDLIRYISMAIPDSMNYLLNDYFETITLYNNRLENANYKANPKGGYDVSIKLSSEKFTADGIGQETTVTPDDWIQIGVYTREYKGKDSLGKVSWVKLDDKQMSFKIHVDFKPGKVSIDPLHLLIDRNLKDNVRVLP